MIRRGWNLLKSNMDVRNAPLYNSVVGMNQQFKLGSRYEDELSLLKMNAADREKEITKRLKDLDRRSSNARRKKDDKAAQQYKRESNRLIDIQTMPDDQIKKRIEKVENRLKDANDRFWDHAKDAPRQVFGYFTADDKKGMSGRFKTAAFRTGVGVGAYMGVMGGTRYLSGGGMTYNNQGQRDIAGIPFL